MITLTLAHSCDARWIGGNLAQGTCRMSKWFAFRSSLWTVFSRLLILHETAYCGWRGGVCDCDVSCRRRSNTRFVIANIACHNVIIGTRTTNDAVTLFPILQATAENRCWTLLPHNTNFIVAVAKWSKICDVLIAEKDCTGTKTRLGGRDWLFTRANLFSGILFSCNY